MTDHFIASPCNAVSVSTDSYLVYNLQTAKLHRLNPTAALILELCRDETTADAICALLAPAMDNNSAAIHRWISFALSKSLLISSTAEAGQSAKVSAEEFNQRARALRNDGAVLAAFVCQDHATTMSKEIAEYWLALGELAHIIGRREKAREAYQAYLQLRPGNAEAEHILSALSDNTPPPRAPDECILQLYSRFAAFYEENMCSNLGYEAPLRLQQVLTAYPAPTQSLDILELGCGTGLMGEVLRPLASRLVGVDLSAEMLEKCRSRSLYDGLQLAEITAYLAQDKTSHDLIVACDTLIYFGDLDQVIGPASRRLRPGGRIAFTVEKGDQAPYHLTDSGRYAHTEAHIRLVAKKAGMQILSLAEGYLRQEYGKPVSGIIVLLQGS